MIIGHVSRLRLEVAACPHSASSCVGRVCLLERSGQPLKSSESHRPLLTGRTSNTPATVGTVCRDCWSVGGRREGGCRCTCSGADSFADVVVASIVGIIPNAGRGGQYVSPGRYESV